MKNVAQFFLLSVSCFWISIVHADADFDISKHSGKVVYVDFWASWCAPCRASFPFMKDMAEKYGDSLVVVAINVDKDRKDADQFLQQYDVNFDIVYDPAGGLAEKFEVKGMPTSYLYDRQGQLLGSHIGFKKKDIERLEAAIKDAINIEN
ncbi:MAG: TlpA family protein disulfide reductase [Granulosicoccus sp.]